MKKLIFLFLLISGISFSQIQVIHFNANWNAANDVKWVNDLTDCKIKSIDIATNSQAATDHKITVVPTILVLIDGEEEERYEADISFSMQATKKEIQEVIDENRSLYNKILCYTKCYGGYLLAVGAGCTFGANFWVGLGLLVGAGAWAYWVTHCNDNAKCKK